MEFANDLLAGLRGKVNGTPRGAVTPGIDWPGLHARLAAAHAARAALGLGESPLLNTAGSFASWPRAVAATGNDLPDVNLTNSADGKAATCIDGFIAGETGAGGRGQE